MGTPGLGFCFIEPTVLCFRIYGSKDQENEGLNGCRNRTDGLMSAISRIGERDCVVNVTVEKIEQVRIDLTRERNFHLMVLSREPMPLLALSWDSPLQYHLFSTTQFDTCRCRSRVSLYCTLLSKETHD